MSATSVSAKIHKWLALVMAVPILFWFASGLFFAAVPIERVRSEHVKADAPAQPVAMAVAGEGLRRLAAAGVAEGERVEVRSLLGRPVALVSGSRGRPRLYDLSTARPLSPLPPATAATIAERDLAGNERARRVELVNAASPEYRGALPAWRVDFEGGTSRSLYVAADTGLVTARRSTLWRVFDFLWSLHILDFKEHEDFNTPLLIAASALAMVVLVTGVILLPARLGYNRWRRRRRLAPEARGGSG